MRVYIAELSKYMIILLLAVYTLEGFASLLLKNERTKKVLYGLQTVGLFAVQFLAFFTIYYRTEEWSCLFYYAFVQVFLASALSLTCILYEKADRLLLNNVCMFLGISFIMLARLDQDKASKQLAIVAVSLLLGWLLMLFVKKAAFLSKLTWVYAVAGVAALSAVLMLGNLTRGSKISFSFHGITFQPSEFVKIIFVLFLAAILCENASFLRVAAAAFIAAVHVVILVLSRDLGSALIFFVAFVVVVFMASGNFLYLLLGAAAGCGASVAAYQLFDHVKVRVLAWQDPFSYIDGQGFQITQSLFALSSGSWFGLGLYGGTPGDIPLVESDFIFSAVCEEMGVLGGICILLIAVTCFIRIMHMGLEFDNSFHRLIALGLGTIYIFQVFLTIGGGIKFIPMTGVTLPLISYGGSSILATMLLFSIIQAFYVNQQEKGGRRGEKKRKNEA